MPRIVAVDTETYRFGEQSDGSFLILPRIICTSYATREPEGIVPCLVTDGDPDDAMKEQWRAWLTGHDLLVFHNASFDLGVACATWPEFEPLVWDKVERGEVTCTKNREKLLNLSTHGNLEYVALPDGTDASIGYSLADLAMNYLGIDMSEDKEEGSVRTQYDLYAGLPASQYPPEASTYALRDAELPLLLYEAQSGRVRSKHSHASLSTEFFQTACDFALLLMTAQGMRVDAEQFYKLKAEMEKILHEDNLRPVIRAGIVRPAEPARPQIRQFNKATEIIDREGWDVERDEEGAVVWGSLDEDYRAALEAEGIKFTKPKKSSLNRKELCARVAAVCEAIGQEPKMTETGDIDEYRAYVSKRAEAEALIAIGEEVELPELPGGICADAEVIQDLASFDEHLELEPGDEELPDGSDEDVPAHPRRMSPLENYQYRQAVQKIVTTELPRMTWGPEGEEEPAERVHFNYSVLLATGRTSSFASKHYPSGNGQQVDPRGRPCYLPEEDCWLLSTDYSALELCSVAQTTYELFGFSEHRNKINAGLDLHCNLGSSLARRLPSQFSGGYEDFLALKAKDPKFFKHWRKFAKPVGLGYPGGLGAKTFMSLAKKTYGVNIMKAAQEFPESELPGPDNTTVAWHAKKLGITVDHWKWTPFLKGIALSVLLKQVWLEAYPEMVAYFEWVTQQQDPHNTYINQEGREEQMLCYTTPLGMHRAGGTFTAIANGRAMQSPSAEGAKTAVFRIMRECRLGRLRGIAFFHNFVHDEVILSVPADPALAAEVIEIVEAIMVDSMQNVMPDVRISVESALMDRWRKEAEPVRSRATGLLLPWRAEEVDAHEVDEDGSIWLP